MPFSWDEMDKKPEACRRSVYELLGRFSGASDIAYTELTVNEREVLRYGLGLNRPLRLADACYCLGMGAQPSRKVLRKLVEKKLIRPLGTGAIRYHEYVLEENVGVYML